MQVHRVSMTMCGMHSGKHPNVPKVLGDSRNALHTDGHHAIVFTDFNFAISNESLL